MPVEAFGGGRPVLPAGVAACLAILLATVTSVVTSVATAGAAGAVEAVTPPTTSPGSAPLGAPSRGIDWVTTEVRLTYGGLQRYYLVTQPADRTSGHLPVVVALHGRSVTPQFEETRMDFQEVASPGILVYPAGYGESWNAGLCCSVAYTDDVDDVGFLTTVIHQVLRSEADADPERVYLAGYSNGGRMALTLACREPELFAGVAVYAATSSDPCADVRPASLLVMASTGDTSVTIGPGPSRQTLGTFVQPTVTGQAATYRTADGCTTMSSTSTAGSLSETTWSACTTGRQVGLDLYQGGSHAWPAGDATTPSGQAVMWAWFQHLGA
jgi:polyhydroxybutyrate depolymerase